MGFIVLDGLWAKRLAGGRCPVCEGRFDRFKRVFQGHKKYPVLCEGCAKGSNLKPGYIWI